MKLLNRWFVTQQAKNNQFVAIDDMLLGNSIFTYANFRLNFFNLQLIAHYISHIVLIFFLFHTFSTSAMIGLIGLMIGKMFITNAWWGGLEVLRTSVRYSYRNQDKLRASKFVGYWLIIALFLSAIFLAAACVVYFYITRTDHWIFLSSIQKNLTIYIITILIIVAIQLPVRVFHSGIYAISRVVRPGYSLILADGVFICTALAGGPWLHNYTLAISMLLRSLVSQGLTIHFAKRMYGFRGLEVIWPTRWEFYKYLTQLPYRDFFLGAAANGFIYSESLLIFIWLAVNRMLITEQIFLYLIFLISPLLNACAQWAHLFYFDWKRQENDDFELFRQKYERQLNIFTPFIGAFYWLLACISAFVVISPTAAATCSLLLPFFLLRSKVAILQIKCFAKYQYVADVLSGFLLAGTLLTAYFFAKNILSQEMTLMVGMLVICLLLSRKNIKAYNNIANNKKPLHIYSWLTGLRKALEVSPVQIHFFLFAQNTTEYQKFRIAERIIQDFLAPNDELFFFKDQLWFFRCLNSDISPITLDKLSTITLGLVVRNLETEIKNPATLLSPTFLRLLLPANVEQIKIIPSVESLKNDFFSIFKDGICFDPHYCLGPAAQALTKEEIREVKYHTMTYLYFKKRVKPFPYNITVYYTDEKIRVIFLIPKTKDPAGVEAFVQWRKKTVVLTKFNCITTMATTEAEITPEQWLEPTPKPSQ